TKRLAAEGDSGCADRDAMAADLGLAAGAAARADRAMKEAGKHGVAGAGRGSGGERRTHLAQDLVLADNERFNAGGNPKQVAGGSEAGVVVERDAFRHRLTLYAGDCGHHGRVVGAWAVRKID